MRRGWLRRTPSLARSKPRAHTGQVKAHKGRTEEAATLQATKYRGERAHHEVLHPIAELVNEQDGEVVHGLPKLDPGVKQFSVTVKFSVTLDDLNTASDTAFT